MRLTGCFSRRQPWWLAIALLAHILLFSLSSAVPIDVAIERRYTGEIQPVPQHLATPAGASISPERDNALSSAGRLGVISDRAGSAQVTGVAQPASFSDRSHSSLLGQSVAKVRKAAAKASDRWSAKVGSASARARSWISQKVEGLRSRARQYAESRRLRKFQPQRGEVEFNPVFKLSPQELQSLKMPKDATVKPSQAEIDAQWERMSPLQKAQFYAWREGMQPTKEMIEHEEQKEASRQALRQSALHDDAHGSLQKPLHGAGVSLTPASEYNDGAPRLSRMPSSAWDEGFMRYKQKAHAGAGKLVEAVVAARGAVRLRKRGPTSGSWETIQELHYPGEGYRIMRGPRGGILFYRYNPATDVAPVPRYWENLPSDEKKLLKQIVPNIKKAKQNNWAEADRHISLSRDIYDSTGIYTLSGKPKHSIEVQRRGDEFRFGYLAPPRLFREPQRKYSTFSDLPGYLQDFLRHRARDPSEVPWRAAFHGLRRRALPSESDVVDTINVQRPLMRRVPGSSSSGVQTVRFPGQKITLTRYPGGEYQFNLLPTRDDEAMTVVKKWSRLSNDLRNHFGQNVADAVRRKSSVATARGLGIKIAEHPYDLNNAYDYPGRKAETINIHPDGNNNYWFERVIDGQAYGSVRFSALPEHLRMYLEGEDGLRDILVQIERAARSRRVR